jgi:MFS family permease
MSPVRPAGPWNVGGAAVAVTVIGVLPVYLVSVLVVQIGAEMGFGAGRLGALVAGFFGCSAVAAFLSGMLGRDAGSTGLLRAAALLSTGCLLAIGLLAEGTLALSVALLAAGLSNGIGQPASNALIASVVPDGRQGVAYGVKQAAIPVSTLLGGLAVPLLALPYGWRSAFVAAGALGLLAATAVPSRAARRATTTAAAASPAAGPFRLGPLLVLSAGLLLAAGTGNALGTFFVASAVAAGQSAGAAGLLAAVAGAAGAVMRVLLGLLADRHARRWLLVVAVLVTVGGTGHALLATADLRLMAVGVVVAYCSGWTWAGLTTYAVVRMHPDATARATGVTQSGLALGAALGPLAFGAVVSHTSYAVAWTSTTVSSVLAGATILLGRSMLLRDRPALTQAHRARRHASGHPGLPLGLLRQGGGRRRRTADGAAQAEATQGTGDVGGHEPDLVGVALGQARQQLLALVGQDGVVHARRLDRRHDGGDGLRLALRAQQQRLALGLGAQDGRLAVGLGVEDDGLLGALRRQHDRLLLTLGGEDGGALAAVGAHGLLHRVADGGRRLDAADLHAVDLHAPLAGRLVEHRRQALVDVVAAGEGLLELHATHDVAQRRDDELLDGGHDVLDLVLRRSRVHDRVVDDRVDADDEVVLGDDRLRREADDLLADVHLAADVVDDGHEQVDAGLERAAVLAEPLDDVDRGLRHDPHRLEQDDSDETGDDEQDDGRDVHEEPSKGGLGQV